MTIYLGGPDGFSPEGRWTPPGWGAVDALYCDLNDDGYADLIVANAAENSVWRDPGSYVYLNGPHGLAERAGLATTHVQGHERGLRRP